MHPILARFLDHRTAALTLARGSGPDSKSQPTSAEEKAFLEAARQAPEAAALVLAAAESKHPNEEVQQALLELSAKAAIRAVEQDPALSEALKDARGALREEGASVEQAQAFLAHILLEEAFGFDRPAESFDAALVEETLRCVPPLARMSEDAVRDLVERFAASAQGGSQRAYEVCARSLLEAAWGEGPEPINPEHVTMALEAARPQLRKADGVRAVETTCRFAEFLEGEGLVGPLRKAELVRAARLTEASN